MRTALASVVFAATASLVACSSSSTGSGGSGLSQVDSASVCNKLINECKQPISQADCENNFGILRVSAECSSKLNAATCDDLSKDDSELSKICFPPCSTPGSQTCNGDGTITVCSTKGTTAVGDCAATCQKVLNKTYSGTCGKSFQTQTSETDKCWCQ